MIMFCMIHISLSERTVGGGVGKIIWTVHSTMVHKDKATFYTALVLLRSLCLESRSLGHCLCGVENIVLEAADCPLPLGMWQEVGSFG